MSQGLKSVSPRFIGICMVSHGQKMSKVRNSFKSYETIEDNWTTTYLHIYIYTLCMSMYVNIFMYIYVWW